MKMLYLLSLTGKLERLFVV